MKTDHLLTKINADRWRKIADRLQYILIFGVVFVALAADRMPKVVFVCFIVVLVLMMMVSAFVSVKAHKLWLQYNDEFQKYIKSLTKL